MASGPTDIQVVVLAARGVNPHLARWLGGLPRVEIWPGAPSRQTVPRARNDIFRWFRDETDPPWLLMLDDDIVPVPETGPLLRSTAEIASPRVVAANGREAHPHTLSAACVKISRRAVELLAEPWFAVPRRGCSCLGLFAKACRAGLTPVKVGAVGHRVPVTVLPGPRFLFDGEVHREPL